MGKKYLLYKAHLSGDWYGMAKSLKKHELVRVVDKLLAEKAFHENNQVGNHGMAIQYLELGSTYRSFLSGQRKLMLSIQVLPRPKKASKKSKDQEMTTMPLTKNPRSMESEDENGAITANQYANDGLISPSRTPEPPISVNTELGNLDGIHRDIVDGFVQEAKPLFTEQEFQLMAIRWTTSLDKMAKIPGIQPDKRYYSEYREAMDPNGFRGNDQEIVDLISSDVEMGEDAYEDEDGQVSPYFNANPHADIQAWHIGLKNIGSQPTESQLRTYDKSGG
ncbi:hypothetical protein EDB81DRAFT_832957, partial [Dactylonectria macrodidyma]